MYGVAGDAGVGGETLGLEGADGFDTIADGGGGFAGVGAGEFAELD